MRIMSQIVSSDVGNFPLSPLFIIFLGYNNYPVNIYLWLGIAYNILVRYKIKSHWKKNKLFNCITLA